MKDNTIEFYVNNFVFLKSVEDADVSFLPPLIRRRLSKLDKCVLYVLKHTYNDNIQNRISCAVAGHLMLRKNGYRMSIGDVKVNRKAYVSMRFADEDNMEIYINGVYAGRYIQSNWDSTPGMFNNIGRYCNGYIHSIRVYNRLLTPQEIKTNYNEDRNRFE